MNNFSTKKIEPHEKTTNKINKIIYFIYYKIMESNFDIQNLRQYRIKLDSTNEFLNSQGKGISLFDLIGTFIIAYLLEPYLTSFLKIKRDTFYLSLIPLGILTHVLFKQNTFLNGKLMNNEINIYKIILVVLLYYLFTPLKI